MKLAKTFRPSSLRQFLESELNDNILTVHNSARTAPAKDNVRPLREITLREDWSWGKNLRVKITSFVYNSHVTAVFAIDKLVWVMCNFGVVVSNSNCPSQGRNQVYFFIADPKF